MRNGLVWGRGEVEDVVIAALARARACPKGQYQPEHAILQIPVMYYNERRYR
jgi:hypothetical protein